MTSTVPMKICGHSNCSRVYPLREYAPARGKARIAAFWAAYNQGDYETALALSRVKCTYCSRVDHVRRYVNMTDPHGRCLRDWREIQASMQLDGCHYCGAKDVTMEAHHLDQASKIACISESTFWSRHGGIEAQRREYETKCVPACLQCHHRQTNVQKAEMTARLMGV